jgi:hypothetical protein
MRSRPLIDGVLTSGSPHGRVKPMQEPSTGTMLNGIRTRGEYASDVIANLPQVMKPVDGINDRGPSRHVLTAGETEPHFVPAAATESMLHARNR